VSADNPRFFIYWELQNFLVTLFMDEPVRSKYGFCNVHVGWADGHPYWSFWLEAQEGVFELSLEEALSGGNAGGRRGGMGGWRDGKEGVAGDEGRGVGLGSGCPGDVGPGDVGLDVGNCECKRAGGGGGDGCRGSRSDGVGNGRSSRGSDLLQAAGKNGSMVSRGSKDSVSGATGFFNLRYYPHPDEACFETFSPAEQMVRVSNVFRQAIPAERSLHPSCFVIGWITIAYSGPNTAITLVTQRCWSEETAGLEEAQGVGQDCDSEKPDCVIEGECYDSEQIWRGRRVPAESLALAFVEPFIKACGEVALKKVARPSQSLRDKEGMPRNEALYRWLYE